MLEKKRIGFWFPEKKLKRMNWAEFQRVCNSYGYEVFRLNLDIDLESQGVIDVLLYKLTDVMVAADEGHEKSSIMVKLVEKYLRNHPEVVELDRMSNVRNLLNRSKTYARINSTDLYKYGVFTPKFCEINTNNTAEIEEQLRLHNVRFPIVCKHPLGHGSKQVHDMFIVFNKNNLNLCQAPCVVQSFVNHNAVLYKVYVVGNEYCCVRRPSLKNFYAGNQSPIFFNTEDVSKADSQSKLSVLDESYETLNPIPPSEYVLEKIATTVRKAFGVNLLGIDVVIENYTGRYAIIDVNSYPGYDGYHNFYDALLRCIQEREQEHLYKI